MGSLRYRIVSFLILLSHLSPSLQAPGKRNVTPDVYIHKCCPQGEGYLHGARCTRTNLTFDVDSLPVSGWELPKEGVHLVVGETCKHGRYRLDPKVNSEDEFYLLSNGYLSVPFLQESQISPHGYCFESFLDASGATIILPLVCFSSPPYKEAFPFTSILSYVISIPLLAVTVLVYLYFQELRNLEGTILCIYSTSLAIALSCLACVQIWGQKMDQKVCCVMGFIIQYCFSACFSWLNVMCFNTWKIITSSERMKGIRKIWLSERRKFTYYSIYGWGVPLVLICIPLVMDLMPTVPASYIKPNFGIEACSFQNNEAISLAYYGPISVLSLINIKFIINSIISLYVSLPKEKKITHMHQATVRVIFKKKKQMLVQVTVLFCVTFLNLVFEVLSWKIGKPIWVDIDFFNTFQGALVFVIFVLFEEKLNRLARLYFCRRPSEPADTEQSQPINQP